MCYFLYLASPLTLSEVRSMLPSGLSADLAPFPDQQTLKAMHPDAQTVARIVSGHCSCNLVRERLADERADEQHLRERYRRLGITRPAMIAALERHRRGAACRAPKEGWPVALSRFVAEHARNAGPSLYHLDFSPEATPLTRLGTLRHLEVPLVSAVLEDWLVEGKPTLVAR